MASMRTQGGSTSTPSSSSTPQSQWKYKVFLSFRKKLLLNPKNAESCVERSGQSLWLGKAGALETLCRQAYGAEQYQKLGIYTYTDIFFYSSLYPNIYPMNFHK